MQNNSWKQERDLLSEAYASIQETNHSVENSLHDDEDAEHYKKTGEIKKKDSKDDKDVTEEADLGEPLGDVDVADPVPSPEGEPIAPAIQPTSELDQDVKDLIKLIANPPPEDELIRLGYEGRLSEYVAMLQKKVDAAQAQLDLRKPSEDTGA